MQICLKKIKNIITRSSEQSEQQPTEKHERSAIVPLFAQPRPLGSVSEKLWPEFCQGCNKDPELLGVKGSLCLLGCEKVGCKKRLFRIDTA